MRATPILSAVLIGQLGLAYWLTSTTDKLTAFEASENLLSLESENVQKMRLEETDKSLLLQRGKQHWHFADEAGLALDGSLAQSILKSLTSVKRGLPVGSTASAARKLKVSDEEFVKKIELTLKDNASTMLYIGSSPSFKHSYVRVGDEDLIYDVKLEAHKFSTERDKWLNKKQLAVSAAKLQSLTLDGVELKSGADKEWHLSSSDEPVNQKQFDKLTEALQKLRYSSVEKASDDDFKKMKLERTVEFLIDSEKRSYSFYSDEDETGITFVKSSLVPGYKFAINKTTISEFLNLTPEMLMKKEESESNAQAADSDTTE